MLLNVGCWLPFNIYLAVPVLPCPVVRLFFCRSFLGYTPRNRNSIILFSFQNVLNSYNVGVVISLVMLYRIALIWECDESLV